MSFTNLPDELINMICENLGVTDLVSMSVVSKRLNYICKETKCDDVYYIEKYEDVLYASTFNKNIKLKLELYKSEISNVYNLRNIHTLNLTCCFNILDVSMLGNVYDLNLTNCSNISDVSMLGNVRKLNLSYCGNVKDVSKLDRVHNLNLSGCYNISDVSNLGNIHTLDLSHLYHLTDVSKLGNVHSLDLSQCDILSDVSNRKYLRFEFILLF